MTGRRYCVEHTVAWKDSSRSHANTSAADQRLRNQVLIEEPFCRDCGAVSKVAGHIVPHAYGGAYKRENLKGQCVACNNRQVHTDRLSRLSSS